MKSVGVIGLGIMGSSMSANLVKARFDVWGYDVLPARRLKEVVGPDDVGLQHGLPVRLDRLPAQMDDAVDALTDRLAGREVGKVGSCHLLAGTGRLERRPVGQAQDRVDALHILAQTPPDGAGSAGDQNALHDLALLPRGSVDAGPEA